MDPSGHATKSARGTLKTFGTYPSNGVLVPVSYEIEIGLDVIYTKNKVKYAHIFAYTTKPEQPGGRGNVNGSWVDHKIGKGKWKNKKYLSSLPSYDVIYAPGTYYYRHREYSINKRRKKSLTVRSKIGFYPPGRVYTLHYPVKTLKVKIKKK